MQARTILAVLAVVFLVAAVLRLVRDAGQIRPASKTWLLISAIFAVVSAWLWLQ
jgi:uncharacterized membrane protein HdeD (DUF308 family)